MPPKLVDAGALKAMLAEGQELAIADLREELIFSQSHLLFARSVPLSRLELKFARLVPRRGTRIVLCDDAEAARHAIGGGFGPGKTVTRDLAGTGGLAALAGKAGEGPAHGAVAQGHHLVGHAGVDQ